jgi:hypothetical protein
LVSSRSACTRRASADTPSHSARCERKKASRLMGSAVSRTVPSANTTRMSLSVWYVFWLTPQHMPLLLLATTPPVVCA